MTAHEPPRAARSEAPGERPRPGPDPARHSARDAAGTALATAALDAMPDSVIVTDLGMTVRAWNPGAERLYGIDAQEAIGRSVTDLLDSRIVGRPPDLEGVLAATLTNGTWRGRIVDRPRIGSRAGHEIGVEVRTAVIRDANRRPVATLALGRDVAEQGRPDLGDEERLHEELLHAQKMEAIGQLASGVAHELNNPLAAIVAFSQLLRRDPRLPDDLRHDADLLVLEADRTRRIVGNLLDFARQRPPERHPTRLSVLVGNVLELQSYNLLAGRVQVVVDVPDDLPPIELDRAQMQQVLLNLTLNGIQSIRATGRPGTMHVSAWSTGDVDGERVRLAVTDDGPGVPPGLRERLFLPFFTTKDPGEGTGLGLSVSFGIVAAHGGRLWYEAPPERGARFVMELPVEAGRTLPASPDRLGSAVAGSGRDGLVPGAGPESGRPWPPGRVPRVLILDDEPSIRAFLAKALRMAGWHPILATDGRQAVDTASGGQIDALLVDHRMAGMSGTEVYEAITGLRPELSDRFIFMSGDVLNPELRTFAEQRRLGLLGKPFDIDAVQRTVRELLDRRGPLND